MKERNVNRNVLDSCNKRYALAVAFKKRESLNIATWSLPLELHFLQLECYMWKINCGMAFSRTQLHHGQTIHALIYTYPLLYSPLVLHLFALTLLANIHRFLIYAPHFGLKHFGWLHCITLRPAYSFISYGNIICDLCLSISAPL